MRKAKDTAKIQSAQNSDDRFSAIVFLSIAVALLLVSIGFYIWNTVRMRSFALQYIQIQGTAVDIVSHHGGDNITYFCIYAYAYEGTEYTVLDRDGYKYYDEAKAQIGTARAIYVDPAHPDRAEVVTASSFASVICAVFFAFFCALYAVGMNLALCVKGTSFLKRLLFVWGVEVLFCVAFLLLFWLGLPNSGFGEVFVRVKGAVGMIVIGGLVLLATLIDGVIAYNLRQYRRPL